MAKTIHYKVTQPGAGSPMQAAYPERTTRIGSNAHFVLAANHPDWYFQAAHIEDPLIDFTNLGKLQSVFPHMLRLPESVSPIHAYGLTVMNCFGEFVHTRMKGDKAILQVFNNAAGTVISNLSSGIFAASSLLRGDRYSAADFMRWSQAMRTFNEADVFTYRPPELGRDVDGKRKPIVELCPTPRLGRHLVTSGYTILVAHMAARFPGEADLAKLHEGARD